MCYSKHKGQSVTPIDACVWDAAGKRSSERTSRSRRMDSSIPPSIHPSISLHCIAYHCIALHSIPFHSIRSFIRSFLPSFLPSFIHSFIHSSFINSFTLLDSRKNKTSAAFERRLDRRCQFLLLFALCLGALLLVHDFMQMQHLMSFLGTIFPIIWGSHHWMHKLCLERHSSYSIGIGNVARQHLSFVWRAASSSHLPCHAVTQRCFWWRGGKELGVEWVLRSTMVRQHPGIPRYCRLGFSTVLSNWIWFDTAPAKEVFMMFLRKRRML